MKDMEMIPNKTIFIWLIILSSILLLVIIVELFNQHIVFNTNISGGNYTLDIGKNMLMMINQTG